MHTAARVAGVEGLRRQVFENFQSRFVTFPSLPIQSPLGSVFVNSIHTDHW